MCQTLLSDEIKEISDYEGFIGIMREHIHLMNDYFNWMLSNSRDQFEKVAKMQGESVDEWIATHLKLRDLGTYSEITLDELKEELGKKVWGFYLFSDNEIVGHVRLEQYSETTGTVQRLFINSDVRGKGYGHKLLKTLIDKAKVLGFKELNLSTMPQWKSAVRLYEKLGFQRVEYIDNWEFSLEVARIYDAIFMVKSLD